MPIRQSVSPIEEVVAPQALRHASKEVMHVYTLWHARCAWNAMRMNFYLATKAHLIRGRGGERWFKVPILEARAERGSKNGNVFFSGAHAVNSTSWTVTAGSGGVFLAGDWVMVNAATNVPYAYMVTSSESGGVIEVWPKLRAATTGSDRIFHMGDVPEIYDTMEIATPEPIFGDVEIAPRPLYSNPFEVEFVTAVRRSP
jgi:hypothetical protein